MGRGTSGSNPTAKQAEKYKKEAQAAAKAYSEKREADQDALVKKYQS